MDIKSFATQLIMSKIGGSGNADDAGQALDSLVGGSSGFDLSELVAKFQDSGGELKNAASSWLGDGANESISPSQLKDALGSDKVEAFASKLGIDSETASQKLADMLPRIVDSSSRHGELLDSVGGLRGLAGFASRLFKRSA